MPVPHWDDAPDVWDTLVLGAVTMPGVSRFDITRELKIDEKDAKGKQGAKLTVQGVKNAEGTITNQVATVEELAALEEALKTLEPKAGKGDPVPFDVVHPIATLRGLQSVLITKVSGPKLEAGIMTTTLSWKQFDAPKKPATAGGGKGGTGSAPGKKYASINATAYTGTFAIAGIDGPTSVVFSATAKPTGANAYSGNGVSGGYGPWITKFDQEFNGQFVLEDTLAKQAQDKADIAAQGDGKDATKTPDKSKGVDLTDLDKPGAPSTAPAPPSTTTAADPPPA